MFEVIAFVIVGCIVAGPVLKVTGGLRAFARWYADARHSNDPFIR